MYYTKSFWDVVVLTLFFQVRQSFLYELRGSIELLCEFVSLFTHQTKLSLEVYDAVGQNRQANKETESQEATARYVTKQDKLRTASKQLFLQVLKLDKGNPIKQLRQKNCTCSITY